MSLARAAAFALGTLADARLPDPPTRLHPVGAQGLAARLLEARAPRVEERRARLRYGFASAVALPVTSAAVASALRARAGGRHRTAATATEAALLALASSQRTLLRRAAEVQAALESGELDEARALLGRHLVSRETSRLDASEVAAATIESLAENLSDGVVAPRLAFALGGAPFAWAYRGANTLDAMWGYRTPRHRDLGRPAARLDDLLNLVPARVTALAIVLAAPAEARGRALATWRRDAGRTASPNAGHPMAAMAGALGVRLEKPGAYVLGSAFREPDAADIGQALRVTRHASRIVASGLGGVLVMDALT